MLNLTLNNLNSLLKNESKFRINQILKSYIFENFNSFNQISTISKILRNNLSLNIEYSTILTSEVFSSNDGKTKKALLNLYDNNKIETVLIPNSKNQYTICVSTQIGCGIKCKFCETGKIGFIRNLDAFEIIEQYVFWNKYIIENKIDSRISNIVLMGMGEPMLNYDNVKAAINLILKNTEIGENHITVSTVGILHEMQKILRDPDWPNVKIAISLHSAINQIRKKLIPIHSDTYFIELKKWCIDYLNTFKSRSKYLTFEYVLLKNINDDEMNVQKLVEFLKPINRVKVNLIPYNTDNAKELTNPNIKNFQTILNKHKITATIRVSLGLDINAACGQLALKNKN